MLYVGDPPEMKAAKSRSLKMWVIYQRASDYPGVFVARLWTSSAGEALPSPEAKTAETLEELREFVRSHGFTSRIERDASDDPTILKTWL